MPEAYRVKVLVHLVEKFAADAISQSTHGLTVSLAISTLGRCPSPSASIGITLDGDVLRDSTSRANSIDSSLVEVSYNSGGLVMEFVVSIKDNFVIVLEFCSNSLPESTKIRSRSDDLAIIATVVVRHDDGIGAKLVMPSTVSVKLRRYAASSEPVI